MSELPTTRYHWDQDPEDCKSTTALFSGSACLDICRWRPPHKVGSLACERCEHFVSKAGVAEVIGKGQYGTPSHRRKVFCRLAE